VEEKQSGYGKRPLWQWIALYVVIAVVIYGAVYYFMSAKHQSGYSVSTTSSAKPTTTKPPSTMQKFSDSNDFQYAYKIFPGNISAASKEAMAGFAFTTKAMSDGSTQITLTSQNQFYKTQQYVVKAGDSLYFIERNINDDDSEKDTDSKYTDDTAVIVDPQGYIAQ
jgi:siroheme synthase